MSELLSVIIMIILTVVLWTGVIKIEDDKLVIDMTKVEVITEENKHEEVGQFTPKE